MYSIVFVAGYQNSEPEHWQRLWYKQMKNTYFVEQDDWFHPDREKWTKKLDETLSQVDGKIILVAHSIGCHTVVEWANSFNTQKVIAALLVAPPDVKRVGFPKEIVGFNNPPLNKLPFPSIAVISEDDPYADVNEIEKIISKWGCESLHVGKKGHINLASNLGDWEEGKQILTKLTCKVN